MDQPKQDEQDGQDKEGKQDKEDMFTAWREFRSEEYDEEAKQRELLLWLEGWSLADGRLRKEFYQRMTKDGFGEKDIGNACDQIRQTCERMQQAIEETGGPWILGEQFTLVDIVVAPAIDRMDDLGYANLWADLPRVVEWFDNLRARPSYKAAFYKGARVSERYPDHFRTAADLEAERGY